MRDTGFIGVRLTGYPGILKTYSLTASQLEREVSSFERMLQGIARVMRPAES